MKFIYRAYLHISLIFCHHALYVGVFKTFKTNFSKACSKYLVKHSGRVITNDVLASLVAEAWPKAFTAVNVMASFKKTGVYPLNPGKVTNRQLRSSF